MQYKFTTYDKQIIEVISRLGVKKRGYYIELALRHFGKSQKGKDALKYLKYIKKLPNGNKNEKQKGLPTVQVKTNKAPERAITKRGKIDLDSFL